MTPDALAALHGRVFLTPRPWSEAEFTDLLADPTVFLLAEAQGFLLGRAVAGEAEILTLAVAPEARRQGLGARLVQAFLSEAAARAADHAFLEVAADNVAALALYRGAGFAEAGRRRGYFVTREGTRLDALVLARAAG
ncbi:GNAT family N-acetyltransferase [Rhodobacter sp. CZR27]|uniref:GNAT family N-acetyltransferase n=1 Tax=Rhodobacter sp. CZR27 TaxID=2033869 RepID=UPI000BBF1AE7|nr:GNAT family N-acetyltransferase [Rhodobacter sp. CZR27]